MKYLCLIYDEEKQVGDDVRRSEVDAFMGEYFAFTEGIKKSGHYLGGEALQPVADGDDRPRRNGKVSTTDGPFAETKEQLGGFYLIKAKDLNDAIQVAVADPVGARSAAIEVRPIMEFELQYAPRSSEDDGSRRARADRRDLSLRVAPRARHADPPPRRLRSRRGGAARRLRRRLEQWPRDGVPANPRAWLDLHRTLQGDRSRCAARARFDASLGEVAERARGRRRARRAMLGRGRASKTIGCG